MHKQINQFTRNPGYWIAFFILVAVLSSSFSSWGMTGISFAVLGAAIAIVVVSLVFSVLRAQAQAMLSGKPTAMDHMISPGGYRRRRYAETPQEREARSAVVPTPARPLIPAPQPERAPQIVEAVLNAPQSRAVVPAQNLKRADQFRKTCLELATDFNPLLSAIAGRSLLCLGQRGSGKSNFAALFIEQMCKLFMPAVIFDYLIDFDTLPQVLPNCRIGGHPDWSDKHRYEGNYWEVDKGNAQEVGYALRECGGQLVIEIPSYPDDEYASDVMVGVVEGMVIWANEREPKKRYSALVAVDEAQQFLPQTQQMTKILTTFKRLNEIGRHWGITLALFTQRAARINKDVIAGTEIYVLMRQTMPQDVEVCEKLIGKQNVDRQQIASFDNGDALVFESGVTFQVHFDLRQSEHKSSQVDPEQTTAYYQSRNVPPNRPLSSFYIPPTDEPNFFTDIATDKREIDTEGLPLPVQTPAKKDHLLERGVNAYLEGHTTIDDFAATLGLTQHHARQLRARVKVHVESQQAEEIGEGR